MFTKIVLCVFAYYKVSQIYSEDISVRVLFTEKVDGSLRCAEIAAAMYCPDDQVLYFDVASSDNEYYSIKMDEQGARKIISSLYANGMCDVSNFGAYINEDPPENEPVPFRSVF